MLNVLIGNDDNHLKSISFMVSDQGIEVSLLYDMLSTAVYHIIAFSGDRSDWPAVNLMIQLPNAPQFGDLTREAVLAAGTVLGLPRISERELNRMNTALPGSLQAVRTEIEN